MKKHLSILIILATASGTVLCGCGNAAPSTAPAMKGPGFKKWSQLTKDEKLKIVETQPIPNKQQMIDRINQGLE